MSFDEVRDSLVISFAEGLITDEEFLFLYEEYESVNPFYPYWEFEPFCLDSLDSSECKSEFRLEKEDIPFVADALQVPARFRCPQGTVCDGIEGFCILLRRLAYPCRYFDLVQRFARPVPELSLIANTVLDWIYEFHGFRLTSWNQAFLAPPFLESYARAVERQGSPLKNCFGFIDGTVRGICRPDTNQRVVYNDHKRVHGLKFQSVALPNGLIGNLYGPVEGRRHDAGMLKDSGLLNDLSRAGFNTRGEVLCLYGDPAYPLRPNLMRPYCQGDVPVLTPEMEAFNTAMSSVRVSVEWLFNDVSNYFKFIDFKKNLKIGMSAVGKQYIVCALLRNILTCLYGNITSDHFQLEPPTVQDYLA